MLREVGCKTTLLTSVILSDDEQTYRASESKDPYRYVAEVFEECRGSSVRRCSR